MYDDCDGMKIIIEFGEMFSTNNIHKLVWCGHHKTFFYIIEL